MEPLPTPRPASVRIIVAQPDEQTMNVVREQWNAKADEWAAFVGDQDNYWTRRLKMIVALAMKHVPGGRSLDVGCGPGLLVRLLAEKGFEAHGADISENMIQKATDLLAELLPDAPSRFHYCPDGGVPFDPTKDRFDLITATSLLDYITDRRGYIQKLADILKPGGCLVLSNTNVRSLFVTLSLGSRILRFWLKDNVATMRNLARTGIWSGGHIDYEQADKIYSAAALDQLPIELGLQVVDGLDLYNFRWLDRDPERRSPLARKLARRWGWNHIGVYRKPSESLQ